MYTENKLIILKDYILEQMTEGKSLSTICKEKNTISSAEVYRLLNKDTQFREKYTHAREQQALFYAEKMQQTIENLPEKPTREQVDRARLSIDTDKFISSKLLPKVYGSATTQTNIQINNVTPVTGMQIVNEIEEDLSE